MTGADVAEVVRALEAATEGGRELDALIWLRAVERPKPGEKTDQDIVGRWPLYSTSVDAALTLVPFGTTPTIGQNVHHRYWLATINKLSANGEPMSVGHGQSDYGPALALCIAALRALAAPVAPARGEG